MVRSKRSSSARKRSSNSAQSTQIIQQQLAAAQRRIAAGHISVQQQFSGPLPPPDILREYEELYPGITQFHWKLYEEQIHHRQSMEKRQLESEIQRTSLGLWCGFIIALSALGAFLWLGLTGHEVIAGVGIIADIATLAGIFVYGTQSRKQERLEQFRIEAGRQESTSEEEI